MLAPLAAAAPFPSLNFSLDPSQILSTNGLESIFGSLIIFFLIGMIVRYGAKIAIAITILFVVMYFLVGTSPSFNTMTSVLWTLLGGYIPNLLKLVLAMLPVSGVAAAAGFALGYLGVGLVSDN